MQLEQVVNSEEKYILLRQLADISDNKSDLFDCFGKLLYEAINNKDEDVQIEAMLELTNSLNLDSLNKYQSFAEKLTENSASKGLLIHIKTQIAYCYFNKKDKQDRNQYLQELINQYINIVEKNENSDIYEMTGLVDIIVMCISYSMENTTYYEKYLNELDSLVKLLPPENYYYKGKVALHLANVYTNKGEPEKAIESDKKFLEYIHQLEKRDDSHGRIYKSYSTFYYSTYRRILSNYKALTLKEVQYYYDEIIKLGLTNSGIRKNLEFNDPRPHLYYNLANKNYEKALIYVDKTLTIKTVPRLRCLSYKIEIVKALGMKDELIKTQEEYIKAVEDDAAKESNDKIIDMQFFYDLEKINNQIIILELENKKLQLKAEQKNTFIILGVSLLLFALLVVLMIYHYRDRKLTRSLQRETESLKKTQEELEIARDLALESDRMKTVFVQNMSHEIRTPLNAIVGFAQVITSEIENVKDDDGQLKIFSSLIKKNSDLLLKLVNDLLQLSEFESGRMNIKTEDCSPNEVCQTALKSIQHRVEPNVKLNFSTSINDAFIFQTDSIRLQQLLINLLSNATKYTAKGEINLSCYLNEDQTYVIFAVADTGVGIPADKSEIIFERFKKLDKFSQDNGLGLHICKVITKRLGGLLYLDTSYTQGARFVLELPNDKIAS